MRIQSTAVSALSGNIIETQKGYMQGKRVVDCILACIIILLLSPLFLVVTLAILIESGGKGSIIYRQKRVGQYGVEFDMFKFRSMYECADHSVHQKHIEKYMNGETTGKIKNDPRITKVGRFIRKTSIDELPQFINVLRGEMSIVGPRPPLPYEVKAYTERDWLRLSGVPGVTGRWQVYGRNQVTFQKMVEMDIEYLQQQSLWEDLKLILLTVPVMLKAQGDM
jgi:lipopolysaccharide/colanic/teichoic acid biosynthesis glycosyltransferase